MIRLIWAQVVLKDFTLRRGRQASGITISEKKEILKVERNEEIWRRDSGVASGDS